MTFSRIKPNGWALNERLTSSQANQLDIDHANSLDKTGDNQTNGGGITGRVDINSSGSLVFRPGSASFIDGYVTVRADGYIWLNDANTLAVKSSDAVQLLASDAIQCAATNSINVSHTGGIHTSAGAGSITLAGTGADISYSTPQVSAVIAPLMHIGNLPSNWDNFSSYAAIYVPTTTSNQAVYIPISQYLRSGSTLSSVTVLFSVGGSHSSVPQHFPSIDVRCTQMSQGSVPTADFSLRSTGAVFGSASSGANWNLNTFIEFDPNQFAAIDRSIYAYYVVLTDEYGTNSLPQNQYYGLQIVQSVPDMRLA